MDSKAWYRLLAHLVAQPQFGAFLKGIVTHQDGKVHFILHDSDGHVSIAQAKEFLKALLDDPAMAEHLKKLMERSDDTVCEGNMLAIILSGEIEGLCEEPDRDEAPGTLREAINREWPW